MADKRFLCTTCGKCCYGQIPLTIDDALANAGRFPLAMVWTTIRQGAKAYDLTARLGTVINLGKKRNVAVQVMPMAYMPPNMPCPALGDDMRCAIHGTKPSRCRTMPFYPMRDENDQTDLLIPRPGWECDTSVAAPVVYRDKRLVERGDFEHERRQLEDQADTVRAYADNLITTAPNVVASLEKATAKKRGGHIVLKFTGLLARLADVDLATFGRRQLPVLEDFAGRTAGDDTLAEYHRFYGNGAAAIKGYLERP